MGAPQGSAFPRPDGVRSGIGIKPTRVEIASLSDSARAIDPGASDVCRVIFATAMTLSAQMRFGRFDGQRLVLVCLKNDGRAGIANSAANNVALDLEYLVDDWVPFADDTLSLVWDDQRLLWLETSRAQNG